MDYTLLTEAGLTEGEAKVYLALLELGPSTTGPIIDKAGIARSFAPHILENLIRKGLVSFVTKQKTKHYQAAQPQKLLDYIDERARTVLESKKQIENALPRLLLLQQTAAPTDVAVYKGFKGLVTCHERLYDALKRGDEYFYVGIAPEQREHFHAYWLKDHARRAKAGITCKLLFHPTTSRSDLDNRNKFAGCDARYMPVTITTPAWFMGYGDVTVIGLQDNPLAIEIRNADVAKSFKAYFEEFWKQTKKFV